MVRNTLKVLTNKISGLHQAAFWLAGFSVLSQLLAFVRDRLLAYHFGAGSELDIYYASFEVPDLLFATAASLVSASILVPLITKWSHEKSAEFKKNIDSVFTGFFVLITVCSILAWVFMPFLVPLFFKSLGAEALARVITFSRILLLSPFLLGLSNFWASIVQYEKRFLLYSVSPLLYNAGIIVAALFGASSFGVAAIIIGVVAGALMHMLVQMIWVYRSHNGPKLTLNLDFKEIRKTFSLSVPRAISLSASSLVGLFFVSLASKFPPGSIAIFSLSFNLQSVPLVIIGASYSLAAFPTLASHYVKKELVEIGECLGSGLRHIIFWSLPTTALFIVLRAHIVRVVLGSGAFNWEDTRMTAAVLSLFVFSIVFQSMQLFLTRAHYAFGKTKLPVLINLGTAALTIIVAVILSVWFAAPTATLSFLTSVLKIEGLGRLQVLSLPIAFSVGAMVSAMLLWTFLEKEIRSSVLRSLVVSFRNSLFVALIVGSATAFGLRLLDNIFSLESTLGVFFHAFISGTIGIVCGAVILWVFKNKEMKELVYFNKTKNE